MAVVNLNGFSVAVYCILVIYQKKDIHALYDTLIYILNLVCQILHDRFAETY